MIMTSMQYDTCYFQQDTHNDTLMSSWLHQQAMSLPQTGFLPRAEKGQGK